MKFKVYVETSVISYLAARPSRDVIIAGRQAVTREWWEHYRSRFELLSSVVVEDEAGRGDPAQCARRLELLAGIPRVAVSLEAAEIATRLIEEGGVPASCEEDALHIAIAATQGADYLVTWNFRHINNDAKKQTIGKIVNRCGCECPIICSPESFGGNLDD
ncbi:MAG: type II toxin-antitoxin system VapC family toxin [Candidatus Hydrogenedentes bacterium]|nr:type II toxin-antitoxin system VapC family toxin [Candidatus Hydrogenedentota bacterium]